MHKYSNKNYVQKTKNKGQCMEVRKERYSSFFLQRNPRNPSSSRVLPVLPAIQSLWKAAQHLTTSFEQLQIYCCKSRIVCKPEGFSTILFVRPFLKKIKKLRRKKKHCGKMLRTIPQCRHTDLLTAVCWWHIWYSVARCARMAVALREEYHRCRV